ncbi:hypothetical protein [Candidatus Williamhamiltonella defendens]|nr:hypothetical protein [Candidatus Hamiltonella defensa]
MHLPIQVSGLSTRISTKAHTTPDVVFLCVHPEHPSMVDWMGQSKG